METQILKYKRDVEWLTEGKEFPNVEAAILNPCIYYVKV